MNIILIVFALGMAVFSFFYFRARDDFFHYSYVLWVIIASIRFAIYKKYLPLIFYKRPILIVNEDFIYDLANKMKYHWIDVEEIYEENAYLYIKLYNPNAYLTRIKNPFKRFINGVSGSPLKINIDMVDIHPAALLEILDNYSIQATTIGKNASKPRTNL